MRSHELHVDNYRRSELVLWDRVCELDPRLARRIERSADGCWLWTGSRRPTGYGVLSRKSRHYSTHRYAYELLVGPIPEGLVIDHLCRTPPCLNPLHLEPVTQQINVHRGAIVAGRTRCPQGHPYSGDNLIRYGNRRMCRACRALRWDAEWRASNNVRPGHNRKNPPCGTQKGYFAHRYRGETCDPCRQAHNADSAARMRKLRAERRRAA